jgi:hypothetical protein
MLQNRQGILTGAGAMTLALLAVLVCAGPAQAESADQLAKQLANPVASLINVPFQLNTDFNIGPENGTKNTLNIQPVIPMSISQDWNLIARIITPLITQNDVRGNSGTQSGLGDINPTLFFSPKAPTSSGLIWGAGPVFLLPTATDDRLGGGKWGVGPSIVLLQQTQTHWTVGLLANQVWSVAGNDNRKDISSTFVEPFFTKGLGQGRTLSLTSESTYNWETKKWNVPINLVYGKVTKVGSQMVNLKAGIRYYASTPNNYGPTWGLRFELDLLYPRK